jgi:hypothetical protein
MRRSALNRELYSLMIQYVQYIYNTIGGGGDAMRSSENDND